MTMIEIAVAIKPNGPSSDAGVTFDFPSPNKYVDARGWITVPAGEQPVLQFKLATSKITWTGGPHVGTFPVSFVQGPGTDGRDSLWITTNPVANPGPVTKPATKQWSPAFGAPSLSSQNMILATIDHNPTAAAYDYLLHVAVAIPGQPALVFPEDPRIINTGSRQYPFVVLIGVAVLLLVVAYFVVRALWR